MKNLFHILSAAFAAILALASCTKQEAQSIMIDYYVAGNTNNDVSSHATIYKNADVLYTLADSYVLNDMINVSSSSAGIDLYSCGYTTDGQTKHPAVYLNQDKYNFGMEEQEGEFHMIGYSNKSVICFGNIVKDGKKQGVVAKGKDILFTCPEENTDINIVVGTQSGVWILCGTEGDRAKYWELNTEEYTLLESGYMSPEEKMEDYSYAVEDVVYSMSSGLSVAITRTDKATDAHSACLWRHDTGFSVLETKESYASAITIFSGNIITSGALLDAGKYVAAQWYNATSSKADFESSIFATINDGNFLHTLYYSPEKVYISISSGYTVQSAEFDIAKGFVPCSCVVTYTQYNGATKSGSVQVTL